MEKRTQEAKYTRGGWRGAVIPGERYEVRRKTQEAKYTRGDWRGGAVIPGERYEVRRRTQEAKYTRGDRRGGAAVAQEALYNALLLLTSRHASPPQAAFANIDVNLSPHNLYGFNPNLLVRQQPSYNEWMENTWMKSFTPPYQSEYDE